MKRLINISFIFIIFLFISCGTPLDKYQPKSEAEKELTETLLRHADARMSGDMDKILLGIHDNCQISLRPNVMLSKQQLSEIRADEWVYDGKVSFSDPKFDIADDKAIIDLKLNIGVAGKRNIHYTMVKENDDWLISKVVIDNY
jgi:hypothetical protein